MTPPCYKKPYPVQYHCFTNERDEYVLTLKEAKIIIKAWRKEGFTNYRVYRDTEWNENDGTFEDGDCIISVGAWPL